MNPLAMFTIEPWVEQAICAQTDPEAFFPDKGGSTRAAKHICSRCPVRTDCLDYALEHNERFGIWGGVSERDRRSIEKTPSLRDQYLTAIPEPTKPEDKEPTMPTITNRDHTIDLEVADYILDMTRVLAATEAHPDRLVRDVRKLAVQAVQALATVTVTRSGAAARKPQRDPSEAPVGKGSASKALRERIEALGTTTRAIREWAAANGITVHPTGGLRADVVDAWETAQRTTAA